VLAAFITSLGRETPNMNCGKLFERLRRRGQRWNCKTSASRFGMSLYEGITHLNQPKPLADSFWNYIVLGCASCFEGTTLLFGWKAFRIVKGKRGVLEAMHRSKELLYSASARPLPYAGSSLATKDCTIAGATGQRSYKMPVYGGISTPFAWFNNPRK
jgi:hypothetical protein